MRLSKIDRRKIIGSMAKEPDFLSDGQEYWVIEPYIATEVDDDVTLYYIMPDNSLVQAEMPLAVSDYVPHDSQWSEVTSGHEEIVDKYIQYHAEKLLQQGEAHEVPDSIAASVASASSTNKPKSRRRKV